jgi:hypothetical protein
MNRGTITTLLKRLEELTWCPLHARDDDRRVTRDETVARNRAVTA